MYNWVLIYDTRDITVREIPDSYIVGMVWLRIRLPIWELSAESNREFSALPLYALNTIAMAEQVCSNLSLMGTFD